MKKNDEKAIKGWLKRRIKITMATLVAFTITGVATYAGEYDISNNIKIKRKQEIKKQKIKKYMGCLLYQEMLKLLKGMEV